MDLDYTHPERHIEGLLWNNCVNGRELEPEEVPSYYHENPPKTLCWACGWNTNHQISGGYDPRVKILHARDNCGLWKIGSKWILRDQPNNFTLGNDYMTQEYLRNAPGVNIPVLERMMLLSDPESPIRFTLMTQAQGQTLEKIWFTLTEEEKAGYAKELAGYIRQWRTLTSPVMEKVNHEQLYDIIIGNCRRARHVPSCKKIGSTVDEWLDNIEPELRKGLAMQLECNDPEKIEEHLQQLKREFPRGYPNVLTHGDLHLGNIIVHNGKIEAIIDWEVSGFYPSWVEAVLIGQGCRDEKNGEMLALLREDGCLEFDLPAVTAQIYPGLKPVLSAWENCPVYHPDLFNAWHKPAFCKCQNYGGAFELRQIGVFPEHKIDGA